MAGNLTPRQDLQASLTCFRSFVINDIRDNFKSCSGSEAGSSCPASPGDPTAGSNAGSNVSMPSPFHDANSESNLSFASAREMLASTSSNVSTLSIAPSARLLSISSATLAVNPVVAAVDLTAAATAPSMPQESEVEVETLDQAVPLPVAPLSLLAAETDTAQPDEVEEQATVVPEANAAKEKQSLLSPVKQPRAVTEEASEEERAMKRVRPASPSMQVVASSPLLMLGIPVAADSTSAAAATNSKSPCSTRLRRSNRHVTSAPNTPLVPPFTLDLDRPLTSVDQLPCTDAGIFHFGHGSVDAMQLLQRQTMRVTEESVSEITPADATVNSTDAPVSAVAGVSVTAYLPVVIGPAVGEEADDGHDTNCRRQVAPDCTARDQNVVAPPAALAPLFAQKLAGGLSPLTKNLPYLQKSLDWAVSKKGTQLGSGRDQALLQRSSLRVLADDLATAALMAPLAPPPLTMFAAFVGLDISRPADVDVPAMQPPLTVVKSPVSAVQADASPARASSNFVKDQTPPTGAAARPTLPLIPTLRLHTTGETSGGGASDMFNPPLEASDSPVMGGKAAVDRFAAVPAGLATEDDSAAADISVPATALSAPESMPAAAASSGTVFFAAAAADTTSATAGIPAASQMGQATQAAFGTITNVVRKILPDYSSAYTPTPPAPAEDLAGSSSSQVVVTEQVVMSAEGDDTAAALLQHEISVPALELSPEPPMVRLSEPTVVSFSVNAIYAPADISTAPAAPSTTADVAGSSTATAATAASPGRNPMTFTSFDDSTINYSESVSFRPGTFLTRLAAANAAAARQAGFRLSVHSPGAGRSPLASPAAATVRHSEIEVAPAVQQEPLSTRATTSAATPVAPHLITASPVPVAATANPAPASTPVRLVTGPLSAGMSMLSTTAVVPSGGMSILSTTAVVPSGGLSPAAVRPGGPNTVQAPTAGSSVPLSQRPTAVAAAPVAALVAASSPMMDALARTAAINAGLPPPVRAVYVPQAPVKEASGGWLSTLFGCFSA